jgi:hypothetical protein
MRILSDRHGPGASVNEPSNNTRIQPRFSRKSMCHQRRVSESACPHSVEERARSHATQFQGQDGHCWGAAVRCHGGGRFVSGRRHRPGVRRPVDLVPGAKHEWGQWTFRRSGARCSVGHDPLPHLVGRSVGAWKRCSWCVGRTQSTAAGGDAETTVRVSFHVFRNTVTSGWQPTR